MTLDEAIAYCEIKASKPKKSAKKFAELTALLTTLKYEKEIKKVPEKHYAGAWIVHKEAKEKYCQYWIDLYECSHCRQKVEQAYSYCPHCGQRNEVLKR